MLLLGIAIMCLGLCTAQQMCVYQGYWNEPNSVITFDSAFTAFTSTIEDSKIDVSKVNTTGEISVTEPDYDPTVLHPGVDKTRPRIQIVSLIVTAGYHTNDDPAIAQLFIQKNGKVPLKDTYNKFGGSGGFQTHDVIVGFPNSEVPEYKLGYMKLNSQKNIQEFHQTGYLKPGDTIRLVTGKMDPGTLDITLCILYN